VREKNIVKWLIDSADNLKRTGFIVTRHMFMGHIINVGSCMFPLQYHIMSYMVWLKHIASCCVTLLLVNTFVHIVIISINVCSVIFSRA